MLMFSAGVKGLKEQFTKLLEIFGFQPSKCFYIVVCEFKGQVFLYLYPFSWRIAHEKAIIDMKDGAIIFYHNISIMTILNLQKIGN